MKREGRQPPGDIRLDPLDITMQDQPIGSEGKALVKRAYELFKFFQSKLRAEHEEMRDLRAMRQLKQDEKSLTSPLTNTLNSCIDNVIADQMDNMPEALMVPEREEVANSAEEMTDVVSYALYQARWPEKYNRLMEDAVVVGTGVTQVIWDEDMEDGDGMVNVIAWHPEDFYPDPMYEDIQDGRACFKATRTTVAWIEEHYPDAKGYVKGDETHREREFADPMYHAADGDEATTLLEYWYKRYDARKRKNRVHMAQIAGGALLYSTELGIGCSKSEYAQGVYAHGQYPFVLYRYREVFRRPFGTGLGHDYKPTQNAIDRYVKYIDDNARESSVQRHFVRRGGGVTADQVADMSQTVIEYSGSNVHEDIQTIQAKPLNGQVYQVMNYLADAMKQDCGQNQFSRGEGGMGVTAATAIQALQEAGGKITRWHTTNFKSAFRVMIEQIMWVMSEYLEPGRKLRIVGGWDSTGNMKDRLVEILAPKAEGDRLHKPAYTVRVQVQKSNPLQIQADNEFVQQTAQVCAQAGAPLQPETVIGLLKGYSNKSSVLKAVQQNSQTLAKIQQLEAALTQAQDRLTAMQAVIDNDSKVMGTQSIAQNAQEGGKPAPTQQAADYGKITAIAGKPQEAE